MFLNPTAKPTPRFTPSPRVVLPAPPGSRIGERGSSSGSGSRRAAQRRITSVAGERLLAVVHHLHGSPRVQCEHRGVDLHRQVFTTPEGAADPGEVDPHPLFGKTETRGD